jgi:hypothetical protein
LQHHASRHTLGRPLVRTVAAQVDHGQTSADFSRVPTDLPAVGAGAQPNVGDRPLNWTPPETPRSGAVGLIH